MSPASSSSSSSSSRWCPTPEQLMILEEMYRGGTRTPNASQIQQITAHLSFYGKIEGKNVFYWFQNHKARDRQKLRRKLMSKQMHQQEVVYHHHHNHHQQQQNHHHLLHYLDHSPPPPLPLPPPPPPPIPHFSHFSPVGFLPQGGVLEDASTPMMNYSWKVDHHRHHLPEMCTEMDKSMPRTYGRDWMMMMLDVGPPSPNCYNNNNRVPLKTLELFPITATGDLKDAHTATSNQTPSPSLTL